MNESKICPLCGSDQVEQEEKIETISDSFGENVEVILAYDICKRCGMDGDFTGCNDTIIQEAVDALRAQTVTTILQYFSDHKANFAGMERALELPQRTLSKWKNGSTAPTAAGVTLVKFLRLFPWLTIVAENRFHLNTPLLTHIIESVKKISPDYGGTVSIGTSAPIAMDAKYTSIAPVEKYDPSGLDNVHQGHMNLAWQQ